MATSFELVDRALQGTLEARIRRMRQDKWPMQKIAEVLTAEGFPISRETVRRWLKQIGLPARAERGAA
jgi:transposase